MGKPEGKAPLGRRGIDGMIGSIWLRIGTGGEQL
jgi:hypothetical protein